MMEQDRQDEQKERVYGDIGPDNLRGLMPEFSISFRTMLERVRADKRRAIDQMIEMVQTEMALERILEG
ncbi:hypothetical protein LCGC14_1215390 [marine sediment metagenome]|uniref:Uncharacterized protein n=1 Tax=marine sediment metagenome TaxID=412755 RepID=A0A0F9LGY8_9ZZZZ